MLRENQNPQLHHKVMIIVQKLDQESLASLLLCEDCFRTGIHSEYECVKVLLIEFLLLWATYLAIMFTNLEAGIGIGIVLATMYFAFSYARVRVVS